MKEKRAKLNAKKKIRKRETRFETGTTPFIRRTKREAKKKHYKKNK